MRQQFWQPFRPCFFFFMAFSAKNRTHAVSDVYGRRGSELYGGLGSELYGRRGSHLYGREPSELYGRSASNLYGRGAQCTVWDMLVVICMGGWQ